MDGFSGGEMFEAYLRSVANKITNPAQLQVGFFEGSTESKSGASTPLVAATMEFGSPAKGIPPRPFFRRMISENSPHWGEDMANLLDHTNLDARAALDLLGESMAGELVQSITDQVYAPLKPATVKAKGFNTTLVDTGDMKRAVTHRVVR